MLSEAYVLLHRGRRRCRRRAWRGRCGRRHGCLLGLELLLQHLDAALDLRALSRVGLALEERLEGDHGLRFLPVQLIGPSEVQKQRMGRAIAPKGVFPVQDGAGVVGLVEGDVASLKGGFGGRDVGVARLVRALDVRVGVFRAEGGAGEGEHGKGGEPAQL